MKETHMKGDNQKLELKQPPDNKYKKGEGCIGHRSFQRHRDSSTELLRMLLHGEIQEGTN